MADKIKVLQIDKNNQNNNDDFVEKDVKSFSPVNSVWFEDDITEDSQFKTDELDKTIDNAKIEDDKISLIRNDNVNFFVPRKSKQDIKNLVDNVPSKINIIDNVDVKDSALPEEILKLRRSDFYQEQKVKDQILRKLNVKIDRDKKKAEKKKNSIQDEVNNMKEEDLVFDNASYEASKEKNVEVEESLKNKKENKVRNQELFDVNEATAVIVKKDATEDISSLETKRDFLALNNDDYTLANTTDDIEKQVFDTQKRSNYKLESSNLDNTTILVSNLLDEMGKVKTKKNTNPDFDEFYNWFNSSRESKRLQKIAEKQNKKLLKRKKV